MREVKKHNTPWICFLSIFAFDGSDFLEWWHASNSFYGMVSVKEVGLLVISIIF